VKTIYFDYDKADIRSDQIAVLQSDASWLKQQRGLRFTVEGNTDERGSEEYNLALGERRANSIRDFLVREGVDGSSVVTTTFGKERPACKEETEECYQRNRRGEFALNR
jgi:peptidoglycan-associated lipoprotein